MPYQLIMNKSGHSSVRVSLTGHQLLVNPLLNKGRAFTYEERTQFGLHGLLPYKVANLEEQCLRSYGSFSRCRDDLEKHIYLRSLQDSNETLFYALITKHLEEMMPIIYTPMVGTACQQFSHIYRHPRGLFLSYPIRDQMDAILANKNFDHVEVIVVSDGERILGLGDQGVGGMGIPIGKLSLYTACAGLHPATTLPILLDVGTNNTERLNDPLYLGWQHERISDEAYNEFTAMFVAAIKKRFPHVLLQWEDFAQKNANSILSRYRDSLCTFNDDIQGTAAATVGTLLTAIKITGIPLKEQKVAILGAGSAGCGIADLMARVMMTEGLSESQARRQFYLVDRQGLLLKDTKDLMPFQEKFTQEKNAVSTWKLAEPGKITLEDVIRNVHPTLLIGVSGQHNAFTKDTVQTMAKYVERPVIFPLSNPTSHCEAEPSDLYHWTQNRAIVGTGSPFSHVFKDGKPFRVDQTNNAYIFPGVGLGVMAVKAERITDALFMAAAIELANCSPAQKNPQANLLPPLTDIRNISYRVALAVAKEAQSSGLATLSYDDETLEQAIRQKMWEPAYLPYEKK